MKIVITAALVVGSLAGLGLAAATPSAADSVSYARVSPARGTTAQAVQLLLPDGAFCPAEANRVIARLTGPALGAPLNVTGNTDIRALDNKSIPGTAILPLLWTFKDAGSFVQPTPTVLDGGYRVTVSCLAGLSLESLGDTVADIEIDGGAGTFVVTSPNPQLAAASIPPNGESESGTSSASESATIDGDSAESAVDAEGQPTEQAEAGLPMEEPAQANDSGQQLSSDRVEVGQDGNALTGQAVGKQTANASQADVAPDSSPLPIKPLLIGTGLFLLVVVVLLGVNSRRRSTS